MGSAAPVVGARIPAGFLVPEIYKRLKLRVVPAEVRQKRQRVFLVFSLYAGCNRQSGWSIGRHPALRDVILFSFYHDAAPAVVRDSRTAYQLVLFERTRAAVRHVGARSVLGLFRYPAILIHLFGNAFVICLYDRIRKLVDEIGCFFDGIGADLPECAHFNIVTADVEDAEAGCYHCNQLDHDNKHQYFRFFAFLLKVYGFYLSEKPTIRDNNQIIIKSVGISTILRKVKV